MRTPPDPRAFTGRYRLTIEGVATDGEEAYLLFVEARQRAVDLGGVEWSLYEKLDDNGLPFGATEHDGPRPEISEARAK